MTTDDVMKFFGSARNMNRVIGLSTSSMRNWKDRGYIPIETQLRIEELTGGKLRANLRHSKVK